MGHESRARVRLEALRAGQGNPKELIEKIVEESSHLPHGLQSIDIKDEAELNQIVIRLQALKRLSEIIRGLKNAMDMGMQDLSIYVGQIVLLMKKGNIGIAELKSEEQATLVEFSKRLSAEENSPEAKARETEIFA